jgi:transposase InsO family protein
MSAAFQAFCHVYGLLHVATSPYYPQSNGFIEQSVQTVKNMFQKCKESGVNPHLAMLGLRTTPVDHVLAYTVWTQLKYSEKIHTPPTEGISAVQRRRGN